MAGLHVRMCKDILQIVISNGGAAYKYRQQQQGQPQKLKFEKNDKKLRGPFKRREP